jgi:hypothetical protein
MGHGQGLPVSSIRALPPLESKPSLSLTSPLIEVANLFFLWYFQFIFTGRYCTEPELCYQKSEKGGNFMNKKVIFGMMLVIILAFCGCVAYPERGHRGDQPGPQGPPYDFSISYQGHFSNIGWMDWVRDGEICGMEGGPQMEAIRITAHRLRIDYQAHVSQHGWLNVVSNGEMAGTTGQIRSLQAIKIWLVGAPRNVRIIYRTFVQGLGWQHWVSNGVVAGSTHQGRAIQAIQIRLEVR